MRQLFQNLPVLRQRLVRHGLLGAGLALSLAVPATPALAQAPRPVDSYRPVEIQPATPSKPRPAQPAFAQTEPSVRQMVILNGPTRTVRYFAPGGSPGEQAALKQLEQAENQLATNESLQALQQQYINTESLMEARRREVQRKLYGTSMNDRVTNSATYSGIGLGQPSPYGTADVGSTLGWLGFPGGYPWSAYGTNQVSMTQESQTNQSLAHGIGDEGQFKRAMVSEMARQANPETAAALRRQYESARANLSTARSSGVTPAAAETATQRKATVTLKDGEKISGVLLHKDNDWITLRTKNSEERIRLDDVTRIKLEIGK